MSPELAEDTAHALLADSERLHLLTLLRQEGTGNIDALARRIAAREEDVRPENVGRETQRRVTVSLVHNHLPRLAEHDVVSYDRESVVLMDVFDDLESSLRTPAAELPIQRLSDE
ncbi:DUF7344 domain-containing protein [Natrinema salaciae]|uniref:DUF7344 domain-containing protein n=1 Tax=Natrinema salaciae TaxID=1186196 RepID=A0A1H9REZ0_9EURY|nr:hypothetical protein [Natrinema salaciae]SER71288.1 hypothetical protein SAMN04489841_4374 [Natrinema salaciae]